MKTLVPLLLVSFFVLTASAQSLPLAAGPERPVSDAVRIGAPLNQFAPRIATSGDLSLVAWVDDRGPTPAVFVSRVDAAGTVLDPAGLRVLDNVIGVGGVVWNGQSFIVVSGMKLVFVTPSMDVSIVDLAQTGYTFAAASNGPDVRLLFISASGASGVGLIVDGQGRVASRKILWQDGPGMRHGKWIAAGADGGFLLLREAITGESGPTDIVAQRLDSSGGPISTKESNLPGDAMGQALAGGDNGFLLARSLAGVTVYRLDASGVFTGSAHVLDSSDSTIALALDGSGWLVAWQTFPAGGNVFESVADVGADDTVTTRRVDHWIGTPNGVAVASNRGTRMLAESGNRGAATDADVFVRRFVSGLGTDEPRLAAGTAALQAHPAIAAGANGYAVTWGENGPTTFAQLYVRRFADDGTPQDAEPIPVFAVSRAVESLPPRVDIVSNGEVYLVGWPTSAGYIVRRLSARTGAWMDPDPIAIGIDGPAALASNGVDAVAVGAGKNGTSLLARRIALSGDPLTSPLVVLRSLTGLVGVSSMAIASDGTDYLAAWIEAANCPIPCPGVGSSLLALRLRADGTALDDAPLAFDNGLLHAQFSVSVGAAGGRYLVAWASPDGAHGVRVSAEGAVLDHDAAGARLDNDPAAVPLVTAINGRFALLLRRQHGVSGVEFSADTELSDVAALPRADLVTYTPDPREGFGVPPFGAAARGADLALAYSRLDAESVPRVFLRLLEPAPARRRLVH